MAIFCYHASHEQFAPSHLLRLAVMAEQAGFKAIHSSDHFHPWSKRQGHSGFSFSWLGAAMQATSIPFSVVCAPGQRYHPAIVAQAVATLAEMFPNRFSVELGSGEAINEEISGDPWPPKDIRNKRLLQSVEIIRRLLKGEKVSYSGLVKVKDAKLWSLPDHPPKLFGAALSYETAEWCGNWADGLLTTADDLKQTKEKIDVFKRVAGADKPVFIQFSFSYDTSKEEAIKGAHDQWRANLISPDKLANLHKPEHFDEAARDVSLEDVENKIEVFTSIDELIEYAGRFEECGADRIILHNINKKHEQFIQHFGEVFSGTKSISG